MRRETFVLIAMPALFGLGFTLGKLSDTSPIPDSNTDQQTSADAKPKLLEANANRTSTATRIIYQEGPTSDEVVYKGPIGVQLSDALDEANLMKRLSGLANALSELTEDNIEEVLEAFEKLPLSFETAQEYRLLMYAWGQFDAPAAIEFMRSKAGGGPAVWFGGASAMSGWAANDPQAAIDWVNEQDDQRMKGAFNMGIVSGWVAKDVQSAAKYVANLDRSRETGRMLGMVSVELLKQGRTTATNWAEGLEDEGIREDAFKSLSRVMARDDVEGTADWLQDHVNQKYSDESFDELAEEWSRKDPQAALEFFMQLPEGSSQREGVVESVETWTRKDADSAAEWINTQEGGPGKDLAVYSYAKEVVRDNPESAVEWASTIEGDELRTKSLVEVGQRWMRDDADAAKAWLPDSGLPAEAVEKISNPPNRYDFRGGDRGGPPGGRR